MAKAIDNVNGLIKSLVLARELAAGLGPAGGGPAGDVFRRLERVEADNRRMRTIVESPDLLLTEMI